MQMYILAKPDVAEEIVSDRTRMKRLDSWVGLHNSFTGTAPRTGNIDIDLPPGNVSSEDSERDDTENPSLQ